MHDVERMKEEMDKVKEIKKTLVTYLESEVMLGCKDFDLKSAGDTADMIKDLADAEKNCAEALYYMTVTEAMNNYGGNESAGYNHYHTKSGEFATKGNGHYVAGMTRTPEMNMWDPEFEREMNRYEVEKGRNSRYGATYDNYKDAKRYYTETKDMAGKQKMDNHGMNYFSESIDNIKEIYEDADPVRKQKFVNMMEEILREMKGM